MRIRCLIVLCFLSLSCISEAEKVRVTPIARRWLFTVLQRCPCSPGYPDQQRAG